MTISIPYLQMKRKLTYDEAKRVYDEYLKSIKYKEQIYLRPFQKSMMICPECLKVYTKHYEICEKCPNDTQRAENAKIDRRLKRLGLIR